MRLGHIVVATWGIADYDHVVETDRGRRARQPFPLHSPMLVRQARYLTAVEISGERPWEWFVVRGISDYGDAGTGSAWRGYASVAAGHVQALLGVCPPLRLRGGHTMATG